MQIFTSPLLVGENILEELMISCVEFREHFFLSSEMALQLYCLALSAEDVYDLARPWTRYKILLKAHWWE